MNVTVTVKENVSMEGTKQKKKKKRNKNKPFAGVESSDEKKNETVHSIPTVPLEETKDNEKVLRPEESKKQRSKKIPNLESSEKTKTLENFQMEPVSKICYETNVVSSSTLNDGENTSSQPDKKQLVIGIDAVPINDKSSLLHFKDEQILAEVNSPVKVTCSSTSNQLDKTIHSTGKILNPQKVIEDGKYSDHLTSFESMKIGKEPLTKDETFAAVSSKEKIKFENIDTSISAADIKTIVTQFSVGSDETPIELSIKEDSNLTVSEEVCVNDAQSTDFSKDKAVKKKKNKKKGKKKEQVNAVPCTNFQTTGNFPEKDKCPLNVESKTEINAFDSDRQLEDAPLQQITKDPTKEIENNLILTHHSMEMSQIKDENIITDLSKSILNEQVSKSVGIDQISLNKNLPSLVSNNQDDDDSKSQSVKVSSLVEKDLTNELNEDSVF
ncbi:hypothetical protein TNIN_406371 [Trichonephila inaurata madagascariensis]|uniref:Uncharacterized protein n=1 Tax=Trichonephila inaurata madagascariensis TaxID=2747483 RepID=A0A8X6WT35_9ARAC|nr:hypothetical protein TNIN_406371 [Trichonephila inaurata madagascariensis]